MRYRALGRFCEYLGRIAHPPNFAGHPTGPFGALLPSFVTGGPGRGHWRRPFSRRNGPKPRHAAGGQRCGWAHMCAIHCEGCRKTIGDNASITRTWHWGRAMAVAVLGLAVLEANRLAEHGLNGRIRRSRRRRGHRSSSGALAGVTCAPLSTGPSCRGFSGAPLTSRYLGAWPAFRPAGHSR